MRTPPRHDRGRATFARRGLGLARLALLTGLASSVAAWGCARRAATTEPPASAVLITIDTMRGDSFGAAGHPELRTPHIDRLFRQGVQFSEAFSPSPMTLPSHTSILSGAWPTTHGVARNGVRVPDEVVSIAEILKDRGFATAAFVSSAALDSAYCLNQGFDVYNFRPVFADEAWRPAPRTVHRALTWWTSTAGRKFLWVHLFEPHVSYDPPAPLHRLYHTGYEGPRTGSSEDVTAMGLDPGRVTDRERAHVVSLYNGEITAVDLSLGGLLRTLEEDASAAVVITADHGESLGERDLLFKHGPNVYAGDVRVPLGVRGGSFTRGLSDALVRTIDVAGTILSLLAVDTTLVPEAGDLSESVEGGPGLVSFGIAAIGRYRPGTPSWDEILASRFASPDLMRVARTKTSAVVESPWEGRLEWYDRTTDPDELRPLPFPDRADAESLRAALDRWVEGGVKTAPSVVDAHLAERLKSLGYVTDGS
jgi:arylsulfatase A-like enzyme